MSSNEASQDNYGPISSAHAIMFHQAVADKLGLNSTDYKCVLFLLNGPKTPGQLADDAGLTAGALTGVIDRLEKAGFVKREADATDRRRILVHVQPKAWQAVMPYFMSLSAATKELEGRYTQQELTAIYDYLRRIGEVLHDETVKLKGGKR